MSIVFNHQYSKKIASVYSTGEAAGAELLKRDGCSDSCHDDVIPDSELDQLRSGFDTECFHDPVLMESYRPRSYSEDIGGLFHCFSLGQQL
jgi:hypothetical protein